MTKEQDELFARARMGMNAIPNLFYRDCVKQVIDIAERAIKAQGGPLT